MAEDPDYLVQIMMGQFRQELFPLIANDPTMTGFILDQLEKEALPIFRQGAQNLVDSGDSDSMVGIERLRNAVSGLAFAVKTQVDESANADRSALTSSGGVGIVHKALHRICPLFPFC